MTLVLDRLHKSFGGVHAVDEIALEIAPASITGLIGPNGSGKTTLLSLVAGTLRPTSGRIRMDERDLTGHGPQQMVHHGIARTFQTTRVMPTWSVRSALELALRTGRARGADLDRVVDVTGIRGYVDRPATSLTNAAQRLVMVASALATGPRVLLLDEPAVGMDPGEADDLQIGRAHV